MITIRLLGGAKKALGGKSSIEFEKPSGTISEILSFLQRLSSDPSLLNPSNLIIAVNGIDAAALEGRATKVNVGDTVTIVTVVHGGSTVLQDGVHVAIFGAKKIHGKDIGGFLDGLRKDNGDVFLQAVDAESVYGSGHLLGIVAIVFEAHKKGVMIAKKVETEFLLRLACTNQISEAIARVGLRQGSPACFIVFSKDAAKLKSFARSIANVLEIDDSVITPTAKKRASLAKRIGVDAKSASGDLIDHLVENAAILTK